MYVTIFKIVPIDQAQATLMNSLGPAPKDKRTIELGQKISNNSWFQVIIEPVVSNRNGATKPASSHFRR